MDKSNPKASKSERKPFPYMQYSGLAFQLAAFIALGVLLGQWLDRTYEVDSQIFTALFALAGLFAGGYITLRNLLK